MKLMCAEHGVGHISGLGTAGVTLEHPFLATTQDVLYCG